MRGTEERLESLAQRLDQLAQAQEGSERQIGELAQRLSQLALGGIFTRSVIQMPRARPLSKLQPSSRDHVGPIVCGVAMS